MRTPHVIAIVLLLATASAAELRVKVLDPQLAAVAGAEVVLLQQDRSVDVEVTSAQGIALLRGALNSESRIRILAPGFAPQELALPRAQAELTVNLHLATTSETVVVTATRTPAPEEETGTSVSILDYGQLTLMKPVSAGEALRFLPGAVVDTAGQRGGLASLFVRGGDSRYNKVIVDGVTVNDPGGTFDFGVVPLQEAERLEFLRGAQSTLYGSDAMTSVVEVWTRSGSTPLPELHLGADGGNFGTADGYAALAGAHGPFDYNLFGNQFNTNGEGVNNQYSNSSEGANLGWAFNDRTSLRFRVRHLNSGTGVSGEWNFNGQALLPPDIDQRAHQNNLLASTELLISGPSQWQHRFTGFEYNTRRLNLDNTPDRGCDPINFNFLDCYFLNTAHSNRAGLSYQADYTSRAWAQTTFGYNLEDENGNFDSAFLTLDASGNPVIGQQFTHGLRLNHDFFGQQKIARGPLSLIAGLRYAHNPSFGNRVVPRIAATLQALRGNDRFSGTRLRFSYATGIKEPRFEESFGISGIFPTNPNPNLRAEENRSFEGGIEQNLAGGRYSLSAVYFRNLFRDQIEFESTPSTFIGQYININRSLAHGAEINLEARPTRRLDVRTGYTYTSTRIEEAPLCTQQTFCDPMFFAGQPLLRRPKHSGSLLLNYLGNRWGGNLGASFVGRRPDSDFLGFGINHAAGYARVDLGGWYALTSRISAYINMENALNRRYEEVVGYPALGANFRAGMRFRIGGE
ncbi:MAG TPA: TonB-dependent receptor [Terriglobales bacterium]|nr:TonB-dependent receptor [Terriglobales bacterium]